MGIVGDVRLWHIASFRCAAELGRYAGTADVEWDAPLSRFMRTRVLVQPHLNGDRAQGVIARAT